MTTEDGDDSGAVPSISPRELHDRLQSGERVSVVDLRDRDELDAWPLAGAAVTHLPYARAVQANLTGDLAERVGDAAEPVVAVCPVGDASREVAGFLRAAGVDAVNLEGGMAGWARLLVDRRLPWTGPATVVQYDRPSSGCLSYLVHDGDVGAVVDPLRAFAGRYVADAEAAGVDLRYAVDTHVHADHVSGVRAVADRTGAEVVLPAGADERGLDFEATLVEDGDELTLGGATLRAVHAPGHTTEMTAFDVEADSDDDADAPASILLSGDSLFLDGVARPDLEDPAEADAYAQRLHGTLQSFLELPDETLVAPGHREPDAEPAAEGTYAAPLSAVRERVAALALDREAFVGRVAGGAPPRPANHERVIRINLGLEAADDEEAFELELGPNNCAAAD